MLHRVQAINHLLPGASIVAENTAPEVILSAKMQSSKNTVPVEQVSPSRPACPP